MIIAPGGEKNGRFGFPNNRIHETVRFLVTLLFCPAKAQAG